MDTPQEQSSQCLRHVNPEATSPDCPSSTVDHGRTTASYWSGQQLASNLATGSMPRGTHYGKALALAGKPPVV